MADQMLVNEVTQLRSQNLSNDQIAQQLLYQGHSNADVFNAMSQADVTPASEQGHMENQMPPPPAMGQPQPPAQPGMPPPPAEHHAEVDTNKISEIAESIIEEKWSELVDHVNTIIEWKSTMELKLASMEEGIKNLKSEFETLNKAILGKIGETDSVMREVGTDIKALEQVFKKILPGFVENVNELSRITAKMKKK